MKNPALRGFVGANGFSQRDAHGRTNDPSDCFGIFRTNF